MTKEQKLGNICRIDGEGFEATTRELILAKCAEMGPEQRKAVIRRFVMEDEKNFEYLKKSYSSLFKEAFLVQ